MLHTANLTNRLEPTVELTSCLIDALHPPFTFLRPHSRPPAPPLTPYVLLSTIHPSLSSGTFGERLSHALFDESHKMTRCGKYVGI